MTRRERYNLALNCVAKVGVGSPDLQREFARAMTTFEISSTMASIQPPPPPVDSMPSAPASAPMSTGDPSMSQPGSMSPGMPPEGAM
jgi:hypothetical protein